MPRAKDASEEKAAMIESQRVPRLGQLRILTDSIVTEKPKAAPKPTKAKDVPEAGPDKRTAKADVP